MRNERWELNRRHGSLQYEHSIRWELEELIRSFPKLAHPDRDISRARMRPLEAGRRKRTEGKKRARARAPRDQRFPETRPENRSYVCANTGGIRTVVSGAGRGCCCEYRLRRRAREIALPVMDRRHSLLMRHICFPKADWPRGVTGSAVSALTLDGLTDDSRLMKTRRISACFTKRKTRNWDDINNFKCTNPSIFLRVWRESRDHITFRYLLLYTLII